MIPNHPHSGNWALRNWDVFGAPYMKPGFFFVYIFGLCSTTKNKAAEKICGANQEPQKPRSDLVRGQINIEIGNDWTFSNLDVLLSVMKRGYLY